MNDKWNDNEIVDLYLARDEQAIVRSAERYGASLRNVAYAILNNRESAEECENDTYMEAWNRIPPHEPRGYLYEFLAKITRHIALNRCRKERAKKRYAVYCELTREMMECIPAETGEEQEYSGLSEVIDRFLETCTQEQQNVFVRRYWYFDTIPQISGRYGFSESKVKTMLHRMRAALRKHLKKEGYTI